MATIDERIATILQARDSGLSETVVEGVTVRWRNLAELDRILASLRAEKAAAEGGAAAATPTLLRPDLVSGIWR